MTSLLFSCLYVGWLVGSIQTIGSKHLAPHVRGLAAVLLRRALLVDEPSLWDCLPPAADMGQGQGHRGVEGRGGQRELQACLLQILSDEGDPSVRRKVSMGGGIACGFVCAWFWGGLRASLRATGAPWCRERVE